MIIIGYQGIGKSSVANKHIGYIDLESSNFFYEGERPTYWYKYYCNIANHLSKQGKIVFVSSHQVVRDELKWSDEKVIVICPSIEIKGKWIKRLQERYDRTQSNKDYKALMNAKDRYEENIQELLDSGYETIIINIDDYDLYEVIEQNKSRYTTVNFKNKE